MYRDIDLKKLTWICRPKMYAESGGKLILETEPFTDLKPAGKSAEAIELSFSPEGSFCFTMRVDFDYHAVFDQCGMILYNGKEPGLPVPGTGRFQGCGQDFLEGFLRDLCRVVFPVGSAG